MLRLPQNQRSWIQLALVLAFVGAFYFAVRYAANVIEGGVHFQDLEYAIAEGSFEDVERELRRIGDANVRSPDDWLRTPLHVAVNEDRLDVMKLLLDHDADPNAQDKWGGSSLHRAVRDIDQVRLLVEHGARLDLADDDGRTALGHAAGFGDMDVVRFLIERGASPHGATVEGDTARGETPALAALSDGHTEVAKYLLFDVCNGAFKGENADALFAAAAWHGEIELLRRCVEAGANPNSAITIKVWFQNDFVSAGPLQLAVIRGATDTARVLLELGAEAEDTFGIENMPVLVLAVQLRRIEIAELLLDYGADVDRTTQDTGESALHFAAAAELIDMARILIEHGADPNLKNKRNETPMDYAVQRSASELQRLFRDVGVEAVGTTAAEQE